MWTYEYSVETSVTPATIWRLWSDVENWGSWNPDIEAITLHGPFAAGSTFDMTPAGQEPVHMRLEEVVDNERFFDVAEFGGLVLRTGHLIEPTAAGTTRIVYRMAIEGEGGDEIGPQITADFPETLAGLVKAAQDAPAS
jgi:uncharacterized protein YndB with AHSA1/START domain